MTVLNSDALVIEGDSLVFTFTLDTAVSTTTSYNWKIVPKGLFPALSSDFTTLTGVVSFVAGESEQTITIPTTTNTAPAVDRSFVLEITDSSDTLVASSDVITLDDNDELSASSINSFGGGESDVLGAATSFEIGTMSGLGGDDYYIITQYQQSDVSISDDTGTNVIKFDYGVEITSFSETSRFGGVQVTSFTVTLESGAEISIASPKGTLSYQIGDGGVLNYDAFKAAIGASGTNSGSALAGPFPVESSTPSPDLSGERPSINSFGGGESDVLGAATSFGIGTMNGLGGDDYYIITQYQQSDVSISDDTGTNVIKFDYGVEITGFSETSRFGGRQVPSFTVTLESGAEISIASPKGTLSYQIGDGGVLDYDTFKVAIGASGTNAGSALANSFPVPFPAVIDDYGPVFTSGDSASVAEDIGDDATIYTATAADADGDTVSYSITSGNDAGVFEIDASTGVVSLVSGQSLDAEGISSYTLTITASSQARGEAARTETLDVDIMVTNVNDVAPVITSSASGDALDEGTQIAATQAIYTAAGTFDVTPIVWSLKAGNGDDAALFSIDTSSGAVTFQSGPTPDFEAKSSYAFTIVATSGSLSAEQIVTVAITDVNDEAPVIASGATGLSLAENTEVDTSIVIYTAAGTYDVTPIVWSLKAGNGDDAALFSIDTSSGAVTFQSGTTPDHEAKSSYAFTVIATSGSLSAEQDVTIVVTDVNDVAPVITSSASGDALDEGTQIAATQAIYTAAGTFDVTPIVWSLKASNSDDAALFSIDTSSGAVTFQSDTTPDFEAKSSYAFTVVATSGSLSAEQDVSIAVTNVDEGSAVFTVTSSGGDINAVVEGNVLTVGVSTSDPDGDGTFTYQWHRDGSDISGANSESYTVVDDDEETSLTVTVSYTDSSGMVESVTTAPVVVPPDNIATGLGLSGQVTQISEDTTTRTRIGEVTFDDADGGDSGTLELAGANAALFELDDTTLYLRAGASLDYETVTTLEVRVQLTEDTSIGVNVPITITNANDVAPVITSGASGLSIDENAEVLSSTVIYTAAADVDITAATWSLKTGNGDDAALFNIDSTTGEVTFRDATTPDFEAKSSYAFTVIATSGGLDGVEQVVTVEVNNRNDVRPVITSAAQPNIDERTVFSTNTTFYTAAGTFDVEEIIWSLKDNNGDDADLFDIDTASGVVTFKSATTPDHETKTSYSFTVIATSGSLEAVEQDVTVDINDINDQNPVITSSGTRPNIDEGIEFSTSDVLYTATGTYDVTPIFWLLKPNAYKGYFQITSVRFFDIDSATGEVTFKTDTTLDYETRSNYHFIVIGRSGTRETRKSVRFEINDIDEDNAITSDPTGLTLVEGAEVSTDVALYTPTAVAEGNSIFWFLFGADRELFDINGGTGVLKFKEATTPDFETKSSYTVQIELYIDRYGGGRILQDVTIAVTNIDEGDAEFQIHSTTDLDNLAVGDVLTAVLATPDPDGANVYTYQWHRDGVDITGATDDSYTLVADDVGAVLTVTVSYIDGSDTFETVTGALFDQYATAIALDAGAITEIGEDAGTAARVKIADLVITDDDGRGYGTLELAGDNAALFEVDDTVLYLSADVSLDHETAPTLDVRVQVMEDTSVGVDVSLTVTDADEGDAVYVIDNSDSGAVAHITDPAGLTEGSTLYARLLSDDPDGNGVARYQWLRGGAFITSATAATYVVTTADFGQAITVLVSYTDDSGVAEEVTSAAVDIPGNDGAASFTITSSGDTAAPAVGDELTVSLDTADPDGNGTFSYQWFLVGGDDIAGATEETYTITRADQTIGVRVSYTDGDLFDESVSTELSTASVLNTIVNTYVYTTVVKHDRFDAADNTLTGTAATELIQGGRGEDTITTGGGDDIVIGGYGKDTITLSNDGAETLVYRFSSDVVTARGQTGWIAIDGADRISNFERGVDKLVLVDVDGTPIDLAGFLAGGSSFRFATIVDSSDDHVITGVTFQFVGWGHDDGPGGSGNTGRWFSINFKDTITVYEDYSTDTTTTAEGTRLLGLNGVRHDTTDLRSDRWLLTDFSLIPNYFETADEDFADGFQVVTLSDVGVDII